MPSGSGLGSSAASAAAGAYAVNKLFNGGLSEDELILAAMKGEAYVSGGYFADNVAPSILGGATLTQSIDPLRVSKLGTIDELILVLIIPNIQILTKDSRDVIPNKIDKRNFITNMANTASITAAFCKNDYALLKDNLIDDYIVEHSSREQIKGNVYLGVINRVEPSIEAVFVDFGYNKFGFLPFKDVLRESYCHTGEKKAKTRIQDVLMRGQISLSR